MDLRRSERLSADATVLERFLRSYDMAFRLMYLPGRAGSRGYRPMPGREIQAGRALDELAAAALPAIRVSLAHIVEGRGDVSEQPLPSAAADPIANWRSSIDRPVLHPPSRVRDRALGLAALLRQDAKDAQRLERTWSSRIARWATFPLQVRDAVDRQRLGTGRGTARALAVGAGVLSQVAVAAVGGALAVAIVAVVLRAASWLL